MQNCLYPSDSKITSLYIARRTFFPKVSISGDFSPTKCDPPVCMFATCTSVCVQICNCLPSVKWRLPCKNKFGTKWILLINILTRICAAEMAVRYAALSACRKVHVCHCNSLGGATWRSVTITGRTDRRTDRQTDRRECDAICGPLLRRTPHKNVEPYDVTLVLGRHKHDFKLQRVHG